MEWRCAVAGVGEACISETVEGMGAFVGDGATDIVTGKTSIPADADAS